MKKRHIIGSFLLGLLSMVNSGCEDFLDQKDTSGINENSLFLKAEDGYSLVTGVYSTFHFSVDYMLKGIWFTANFPTQDFHNDGSDTFWNTYEVPTDFDALNTFWVGNYIGISRANAAIPILQRMKDNGVLSEKEANTGARTETALSGVSMRSILNTPALSVSFNRTSTCFNSCCIRHHLHCYHQHRIFLFLFDELFQFLQ